MKTINFKKLIAPAIVLAVLAILMVIGTFFDLQISKKVAMLVEGEYLSLNIFGIFFEIIGEMPIYLITAFACALIFTNVSRRDKKVFNRILQVVTVIGSIGVFFYMNHKLFKYLSEHFDFAHLIGGTVDFIAYGLLGACFTVILFYLCRKLPSSFLNKMFVWSFIVLGTVILSQVATHVVKAFAGRPRYRAMFVTGDFSIFKNWYEFSGGVPEIDEDLKLFYGATKDWFKSFPSGHASCASTIIPLVLIPAYFENTNTLKKKIITISAVSLYIAIVMFNRIFVGAHFLTDVTFACIITVISFYLSKIIAQKFFAKINVPSLKERKKPCLVEQSQP